MGALSFEADIDISKFLAKTAQIDKTLTRLAQQATNSGSMLDRSFQNASKSASLLGNDVNSLQRNLLGLASAATLGRLGQQVISIRGEYQQLGIAFEVMLGSKEKADKLMQEQIAFAAKTPFTLTDVATNTKQLLAMGIGVDSVMDTMKALGDVAAGVSVPLSRVAVNYGQVATSGKLMGRELRDFNMAGIPLIDELAKNLGKAKSEIAGMVEAGQIGFPDVEKAFQTMAGEGGKFYNLMEKQNKSVTGQISNLTDKLQVMANKIGQENEGLIYAGISGLSTMVEHYKDILNILKVLVVTYGAYRAVLMLTAAAQAAQSLVTQIRLVAMFRKELGLLTAAQQAFNMTAKANPYALIASGLAFLVTAVSVLSSFSKESENAGKVSAEFTDSLSKETQEIKKNFKAITDAKDGSAKHAEAIKLVNEKYKDYLPNLITEKDSLEKIKKAQDDVTASMAKGLAFKAQEGELSSLKSNVDKELAAFYSQIDKAGGKLTDIQKGQFKAQIEQYKQQAEESFKTLGYFPSNMSASIGDIFSKVSGLSFGKGIGGLGITGLELSIKDLISSEKELDQKTSGLKTTYESYLEALGLTGKSTDDAGKDLKTVGQRMIQLQKELIEAEKKLVELKKDDSTATDEEINKQTELVEAIRAKLGLNKKQKEAVDELKVANEELARAVKAGDDAAAAAAAKRITVLEQEKKNIDDLMEAELRRAWRNQFDGQSMPSIAPIGPKPIVQVGSQKTVQGILYEVTAIDKTGPVWKKVKAQFSDLKKHEKDLNKKGAKDQEDLDEKTFKKREQFQEDLLNYSRQFTGELLNQMNLTEKESKMLNSLADTITNIASGDILAAAFSGASFMLSVLSGNGKEDPTIIALQNMNEQLEQQANILANLKDNNYLELAAKQYNDLGKSIDLTSSKLKTKGLLTPDQMTKLRNAKGSGGADILDEAKNLVKNWSADDFVEAYTKGTYVFDKQQTEWVQSIVDSQKQRAELVQSTFREALGFDASNVSDSIIQGIEDGLKLGENNLGDFAESFGDLIKKALMQSIIDSMKLKLTDGFLTNMTEFLTPESQGGKTITPGELATLESNFAESVKQGTAAMDAIKPILDKYSASVDSASNNSFEGAIKAQITEDTGSLIAGNMVGIRTDLKTNQNIALNQLELMDQGLSVWQGIERNTRGISRLENIENGINELVRINKQNG